MASVAAPTVVKEPEAPAEGEAAEGEATEGGAAAEDKKDAAPEADNKEENKDKE